VSKRLNARFTGVTFAQYALCPISYVDYQRLTTQPAPVCLQKAHTPLRGKTRTHT